MREFSHLLSYLHSHRNKENTKGPKAVVGAELEASSRMIRSGKREKKKAMNPTCEGSSQYRKRRQEEQATLV